MERNDVLEPRQLAGATPQFDAAVVDDRHAGRVVAAIFEAAQAVNQNRNDFLRPDVSNDPAHFLLRSPGPHPRLALAHWAPPPFAFSARPSPPPPLALDPYGVGGLLPPEPYIVRLAPAQGTYVAGSFNVAVSSCSRPTRRCCAA